VTFVVWFGAASDQRSVGRQFCNKHNLLDCKQELALHSEQQFNCRMQVVPHGLQYLKGSGSIGQPSSQQRGNIFFHADLRDTWRRQVWGGTIAIGGSRPVGL
jgi:hypothetical protein